MVESSLPDPIKERLADQADERSIHEMWIAVRNARFSPHPVRSNAVRLGWILVGAALGYSAATFLREEPEKQAATVAVAQVEEVQAIDPRTTMVFDDRPHAVLRPSEDSVVLERAERKKSVSLDQHVLQMSARPPEVEVEESVQSLLERADRARAAGEFEEAVRLLERVVRERSLDANAPLAAFTWGRLELERLDRPARAVEAFKRALELQVPEPVREDCWAHLSRAHQRAGDDEERRSTASRYLEDYPNGHHARDMIELNRDR